jgi:CheY-like chemotaxis protein
MADRHVLLIDSDKTFFETFRRALAPHGVEVVMVEDGESGLARVRELAPELVVIAVELPKKDGYGLFSRAKKGAAKNVPIALVTSSVTPDDFAKHKKLSTHADEYIDKRTVSAAELVRRIDSLIQLGPAHAEELDLPLEEAEEFAIDEDMQLEEDATGDASGGEFAEATRLSSGLPPGFGVAGPRMNVDENIAAETDAAFAALGMEDDHDGAFDVEEASSTAVRPQVDLSMMNAGIADAVPAPIPPRQEIEEADPPTQLLPPEEAAEMHAEPELLPEPEPEIPVEAEAEAEALPELEAEAEPEPEPLPEAVPHALAAVPEPIAQATNDLDLGLDAVAASTSAPRPSADAARVAELSAENARLQRELELARAQAVGGPGTGSGGTTRESEFKNLRQMISRKEKELDDLKEEIEARDKAIQQAKDKLKESDRKFRDSEERALNLQEDLVTANAQVQTLTHDKDKGLERERGLKARLEASQTEVRKNHDEIDGLKKKATADAAATSEALAREKAEHQKSRDEAATARKALEIQHQLALGEAHEGRVAALASLQQELEDAHAGAVAAVELDRASKLAQKEAEHESAVRALHERHTAELTDLHGAHQEAIAAKERERLGHLEEAQTEREQALAAAEAQRQADLAAAAEAARAERAALEKQHADALLRADNERRAAVADAEARRQEQLAEAEERRVADLAAAADAHASEVAAVTASFESEREEMRSSHEATAASLNEELSGLQRAVLGAREQIAKLEGDVASRNLVITARDGMIANLETEVRTRDEKITGLKADIAELETQNAQFQEQVLRAYQKIKNDDAVVEKAKKAMAIALTLLEDGKSPNGGEAKS